MLFSKLISDEKWVVVPDASKLNIQAVFAVADIPEPQHVKVDYALVKVWLENSFDLEQTTFYHTMAEHTIPKAMLRTMAYVFLQWERIWILRGGYVGFCSLIVADKQIIVTLH